MKKMASRKTKESEVKSIGDSEIDFIKDNVEVPSDEPSTFKMPYDKDKKIAVITIKVSADCGKVPTTYLEDVFNIYLDTKKTDDNVTILYNKLVNVADQCKKLVLIWTDQVNK